MPDIKKDIKYSEEQSRLLDRVLNILHELSNEVQDRTNITFLLCDLDENIQIQNSILDLGPEIRRIYSSSGCAGITHAATCKRPYLSIIRFILKHHGKELYSCDHHLSLGIHQYKRTKRYRIFP